jgi:peptidylprolyl isomerase
MANAGKNTNGSQFFITFVKCPWLDGKHVVYGEVVEGKEVVEFLHQNSTENGTPKQKLTISNCGQI